MPPKARKKKSAKSSNVAVVDKNWETALCAALFGEDTWQACVFMVVGRSPEEEELNKALATAVQQPLRKCFTSVTLDSTLAKIHELGIPKAKKTEDVPMFFEVTEQAKVLLDAGKEIPCELMAKILKFQLLQIKTNDQRRRAAEKAVMENAKAGSGSASKEKAGAKGLDKKTKNQASPAEPSKEKTTLKRRGDAEPPKFIDDEPDDGPHHYILLVGFYQPNLLRALDAIGVHVANVIKLCSEHTQTSEGRQEQYTPDDSQQHRASPLLDTEVHRGVELTAQDRKLELFWSGLRPVLDSGLIDSKLHDVAQLTYTVPEQPLAFHSQDPEAVLALGSKIFDGVACLIYDCLDWRRQHQHYLNSIKFITVPTAEPQAETPPPMTPSSGKKSVSKDNPLDPCKETKPPPRFTDVDMRYYSNLLDLVPPEACSVPIILHCMLEQVGISTEQSVCPPSNVAEDCSSRDGSWLDHQLSSYMLESFLPLVHTEEERTNMINSLVTPVQNVQDRKRLLEKFAVEDTQKKSEGPLVFRHHDEMSLRLREITVCQAFDPAEVELSMIKLSPVWQLIHSAERNSNSCWMTIKQQLQHHFTDGVVSWPEVARLFHQSVFESLPLTMVNQQGLLQHTPNPLGTLAQQQTPSYIIPWDNPLSYAKQQLYNQQKQGQAFLNEDGGQSETSRSVCSLVELSDIQNCRQRSLCEWHYTEHHNATIFPQVLQVASEEYCCLDTFRGSHNNILYIFCHNPLSPHREFKEFWDAALHTDVRFRKYLDHVANVMSDWTEEEETKRAKEEETKREAMQHPSPAESPKGDRATVSETEDDTQELIIRKDSLKAWKMEQDRLKEEETNKKSKKDSSSRGKQQKEQAGSAKNKKDKSKPLSGDKKSRAETGNSSKRHTDSIGTIGSAMEEKKELHLKEEPCYAFTGYSMDGKLIHVSGCVQHLFPSDGGRITVENVSYAAGSKLLKVGVAKDGHYFYTHINHIVDNRVKSPQPANKQPINKTKDAKGEEPVEIKIMKHGSLSAVLDSGIHLSYSFYGPTGQCTVSPQVMDGVVPGTESVSSSHLHAPSSSTHCSKTPDKVSAPSETHRQSKMCEGQPTLPSHPFNSLNLSVPNGLLLQFLREDTQSVSFEEQILLVRQSFPLHGRGHGGQVKDPNLSKELSRIITSQGAVVRFMRDGSTEVLFADGTVSVSQDSGPVWVPDSEVKEEITPQEVQASNQEGSSKKNADPERGCWVTTTPSGSRICTVGTTHKHIPITPLLVFRATDPITHHVMLSREDLVVSVQNPDGSQSIEHADGTRITSLYQDRPTNTPTNMLLHTGERPKSSECVCGSPESLCLTRCAQSVCESECLNICDNEKEISMASSGSTYEDRDTECASVSVCENGEDNMDKNSVESIFAEETVVENDKRSECESGKVSVSTKERVLFVEKEGCATVVMYPERHTAHVFLADGTVITGDNHGAYQVFPSSVGILQIQTDGKCVYSTDPPISPRGGIPTGQPGSYTMSHTDKVACDITDLDGNHFQVTEDGQVSEMIFSPAGSTLEPEEEEVGEEEDREMAKIHVRHREHCPRLFLVHEDGSGTELLSSQTVEELLYQAYSDPTITLLKEPLPDTKDEFGITILKPGHSSMWSQWLLGKQNPDITPPNLRNRTWHDFPRVEKKTQGPTFGSDMGRGLSLTTTSSGSPTQSRPVKNCPEVLEMRELCQHRPFTTQLKNDVDTRLKEYIESLIEKEQRTEEMMVKDPRTKEESVHANDLLKLVLSFSEAADGGHTTDKRTSVDIASLYIQGVEQSHISEDTTVSTIDSVSKGNVSVWTERLVQHRQELCEDKAYREALRKRVIVPYFRLENVPLYQSLLQHKTPNMRSMSMDLPPIPKSPSGNAEDLLKDAPLPQENTTPRPLNPTPAHAASHAAGTNVMPVKRPTNPTPQSAGRRSPRGSYEQFKSVQLDVTGKRRRTQVRLPSSILSSKPSSVPNHQFLSVEEPVRRRCRTISLTGSNIIVRGFQLHPTSVDFGTLRESSTYAVTVVMKNVGVDTCRFYVKQPRPATGLRVIYNPGPVPAGLHVELQVKLFAMCAVHVGEAEPKNYISQDIIIHTETDILYLPVTATILPEQLYDIWLQENPSTPNKKSLRVLQLLPSPPARRRVAPPHRRLPQLNTPGNIEHPSASAITDL